MVKDAEQETGIEECVGKRHTRRILDLEFYVIAFCFGSPSGHPIDIIFRFFDHFRIDIDAEYLATVQVLIYQQGTGSHATAYLQADAVFRQVEAAENPRSLIFPLDEYPEGTANENPLDPFHFHFGSYTLKIGQFRTCHGFKE